MDGFLIVVGLGLAAFLVVRGIVGKGHKKHTTNSGPVMRSSSFRSVAEESGFFKVPLEDWLVEAGERAIQKYDSKAITEIKSAGLPLTPDEKKALQQSSRTKLGWRYVNSLSEAGKEIAADAISIAILRANHLASLARDLENIQKTNSCFDAEIVFAEDERTCSCVRSHKDRVFSLDDLPSLPLTDCDALYCRCLYVFHPKEGRLD